MCKDKALGIGAAILGIVIAVYSQMIKIKVDLNEPGPRLFPLIAGIGILICGIGIYLSATSKENDKVFLDREGVKRFVYSMLILVVYAIVMKLVGFLITTPFAVVALSRLFSQKKYNWAIGIIIGVIAAAAVYGIFTMAFKLPLPNGILL